MNPITDFSKPSPGPAEVTTSDRAQAEVARLADLDPLQYEIERQGVARELGVRVSALDQAVTDARPKPVPNDTDGGICEPEPWYEPVDGTTLANQIEKELRRHVVFATPEHATAATLWILGSYWMKLWSLWPKVLISSPEKRCGKTTLMEVMESFVCRALMVSNISAAGLFRAIEAWQPALLIDEADRFLGQDEETNGIINAGHRRRTAVVIRVEEVNGSWVPVKFSVWGPQVIAGIGQQADTLIDRSIRIGLRRKQSSETTDKLPADYFERQYETRRQIVRWTEDAKVKLCASAVEPPLLMGNDRAQDNWSPLFRIAETLGAAWYEKAERAYQIMEGQEAADLDDTPGVLLLRDIAEVMGNAANIGSTALVEKLLALEGSPWAEWRRGSTITARGVAKLLKPFGVFPRKDRIGRYYSRKDLQDALARYLPEPSGKATTSITSDTHDTDYGNQINGHAACDACGALGGATNKNASKRHPDLPGGVVW